MTREEIKHYILTKITYDYITPNCIFSKWYSPDNLEIVQSLQIEIDSLDVDVENKRFRLKRYI